MVSTSLVRGATTEIRQVASRLAMKNSGMSNQARTIERKANKQCVHYWIIDRDNVGRCVKCGEMKDFGKLLRMTKAELSHWGEHMDGFGEKEP